MNREDIIRMAREAGLIDESFERDWYVFKLERFAALIASRVAAAAKAEEREVCAKVCEEGVDTEHPTVTGHIMKAFGKSSLLAAAIRARGQV